MLVPLKAFAEVLPSNAQNVVVNGYAPVTGPCPVTRPAIRDASSLPPEEEAWVTRRRRQSIPALQQLLSGLNITDFDVDGYFATHSNNSLSLPNIGIAVSGGGYRALMNGAGAFAAMDSRTEGSGDPGHLGGLLQASTYVSGLSGGAWLLGSIYMNNLSTVTSLLGDSSAGGVWDFNRSILLGPEDHANYYNDLLDTVRAKRDAGFPVTITDFWYGIAVDVSYIANAWQGPRPLFSAVQQL